MEVERVGAPQNGRMTVVFFHRPLPLETTLLRKQTVELHCQSSGIGVPVEAIRTEPRTVEDPETGATTERMATGVYTVVGLKAESRK